MNWLTDHELRQLANTGPGYPIKPTDEQIQNLAREAMSYREYLEKLKTLLRLPD